MGANLKEVRERISSVVNIQKSTKAMKMVSAAKLRKAQDAIVKLRPYSDKLDHILKNILSNIDGDINLDFSKETAGEKVVIVLITSNKGLAGAFNSNLIKRTAALINDKYAEQRANNSLEILCIGKKGRDFFKRNYKDVKLNSEYVDLFDDLTYQNLMSVSGLLMDDFLSGKIDKVDVVYSRFKNAGMQFSTSVQYLPVEKMKTYDESGQDSYKADYLFEPNKEELLQELIPSILHTKFQKFILDTHASEHGARMTAMDKATENANDLLKDLKITYNKARQEAITSEISEIVGGAAALNG
ncbi:ATP synthase F1 subunit gamma [Membranihabitans maritimus]|uniref:ATP synthase F1 subunit gamma n=1 Tax=Membranihabitans maritimus TaxID=2904244 RepID=UPI001EFFD56B|nr:ATP synthase F1 subunit gamma [Membranihabitans maritimus]